MNLRAVVAGAAMAWSCLCCGAGAVDGAPPENDLPAGDRGTTAAEPGYLGVKADDSGPGDGVRLVEVIAGGPAAAAGLRDGDLVTAVQGEAVRSLDQFAGQMRPIPPDARVAFTVIRNDEKMTINVTLGSRPGVAQTPTLKLGPALPATPAAGAAPLGLRVQGVTEKTAQRLSLPVAQGAIVTHISAGSPADKAGLKVDAVIVTIDGWPVTGPDDAAKVISAAQAGQELKFELYEGKTRVERTAIVAASAGKEPPTALGVKRTTSATGVDTLPPLETPAEAAREGEARVERLERRLAELEKQLDRLQRDMQKLVNDINGAPDNNALERDVESSRRRAPQ